MVNAEAKNLNIYQVFAIIKTDMTSFIETAENPEAEGPGAWVEIDDEDSKWMGRGGVLRCMQVVNSVVNVSTIKNRICFVSAIS